jgi:hypothetical protein
MRNRLSHVFFLAVLVMLLSSTAIPAAAATTKFVNASTVLPVKDRTVNGASFWAKNNKSSGYDLYVVKSGKKYLVTNKLECAGVASNGSTVYYVAKMAKGKYLYRYTISNKKKKKIGKLASAKQRVETEGFYDGQVFFTIDSPDGTFHCADIEDGDVENLLDNPEFGVTSAEQHGKYFILTDGTGEEHSYVGVYNADKFRFTDLWRNPAKWYATSYNIYCAMIVKGLLPAEVGNPAVVHVAKYNYKTGIYTVYAMRLEVTSIISISSSKMVYRDGDGVKRVLSF